jgi:hypothetical protein
MNTEKKYSCGCGQPIPTRRWNLGYKLCMECGEAHARTVKHCIVPLHKSNYIPITSLQDLRELNPKRRNV